MCDHQFTRIIALISIQAVQQQTAKSLIQQVVAVAESCVTHLRHQSLRVSQQQVHSFPQAVKATLQHFDRQSKALACNRYHGSAQRCSATHVGRSSDHTLAPHHRKLCRDSTPHFVLQRGDDRRRKIGKQQWFIGLLQDSSKSQILQLEKRVPAAPLSLARAVGLKVCLLFDYRVRSLALPGVNNWSRTLTSNRVVHHQAQAVTRICLFTSVHRRKRFALATTSQDTLTLQASTSHIKEAGLKPERVDTQRTSSFGK